jgi:hypothetical protein
MATLAKRPVTAEAKSTFFHISLLRFLSECPTTGRLWTCFAAKKCAFRGEYESNNDRTPKESLDTVSEGDVSRPDRERANAACRGDTPERTGGRRTGRRRRRRARGKQCRFADGSKTEPTLRSILWLRSRIFLVNLGLRYVEWQIERKRRQGAMERRR